MDHSKIFLQSIHHWDHLFSQLCQHRMSPPLGYNITSPVPHACHQYPHKLYQYRQLPPSNHEHLNRKYSFSTPISVTLTRSIFHAETLSQSSNHCWHSLIIAAGNDGIKRGWGSWYLLTSNHLIANFLKCSTFSRTYNGIGSSSGTPQ